MESVKAAGRPLTMSFRLNHPVSVLDHIAGTAIPPYHQRHTARDKSRVPTVGYTWDQTTLGKPLGIKVVPYLADLDADGALDEEVPHIYAYIHPQAHIETPAHIRTLL